MENRPATDRAAIPTTRTDDMVSPSTIADPAEFLAHLRRRRAAAQRLAILDCGHADPSDCIARVPPSLPSSIAAERARQHLAAHGLLSEVVETVLAESVA